LTVRTFIALELSEVAKAGILACVDELRDRKVRASWARPATIHLTLRFLGDLEESILPSVIEAVERAAAGIAPFEMATSGIGAFPSPARPRVLWSGIDAPDALYELHAALEDELKALGFARERRSFRPHVTLGRLRDSQGSLERLLRELPAPEGRTRVESVRVMKSTLAPSGATHDVIGEVPLGDRSDSPSNPE